MVTVNLQNAMSQDTSAVEGSAPKISVPKAGSVVYAITSGKGGVGKSNIAANLAICLAASNKKVVLLDADFSLANLDVLLNINSRYNIGHVISGLRTIEEVTQTGPAGIEVICGASGLESLSELGTFQRQRILDDLSKLQENADAIVIDTAAGMTRSVTAFCLASDYCLVVTTPEPTAMTDAYAMIKVLVGHEYGGRISLVINMADTFAEGKRVYQQIAQVTRRFLGTHVYEGGILLRDQKLSDAVKLRKPVVLAFPRSHISSAIIALASKLARCSAAKIDNVGFFRRVVNWFL